MTKKMAKLFLIVITQCISLTLVAQTTVIPRRVTIDNRQYTISNSDPRFNMEGVWIRDNEGLILTRNYEPGRYKRVEPIEFSSMTLNNAVAHVLDITRIRDFTGRPILIQVYPNDSGIIVATEYYVPAKHPITIDEIDQINHYIKKNISFKMPSNIVEGDVIAPVSLPIHFKNFVNDYETANSSKKK